MTKNINGWVQRSNWCCFMLISLGVHTYVAFQSLFLPFPVIWNHIDCLFPSFKSHVLFIPFFGFVIDLFSSSEKNEIPGSKKNHLSLKPGPTEKSPVFCHLFSSHHPSTESYSFPWFLSCFCLQLWPSLLQQPQHSSPALPQGLHGAAVQHRIAGRGQVRRQVRQQMQGMGPGAPETAASNPQLRAGKKWGEFPSLG